MKLQAAKWQKPGTKEVTKQFKEQKSPMVTLLKAVLQGQQMVRDLEGIGLRACLA